MMPVPQVGTRVGLANFIIGQTGLKQRRFPLQTNYACGVQEKLSLQIDPAVGSFVSLPELAPIDDPTLSWTRQLLNKDGILQGQSEFLIKVVELDPQQYLSLKETLKQIEYNERKKPVLARKSAETDVRGRRGRAGLPGRVRPCRRPQLDRAALRQEAGPHVQGQEGQRRAEARLQSRVGGSEAAFGRP